VWARLAITVDSGVSVYSFVIHPPSIPDPTRERANKLSILNSGVVSRYLFADVDLSYSAGGFSRFRRAGAVRKEDLVKREARAKTPAGLIRQP